MTIKTLLAKKLSFIDGNVRFADIHLNNEIEIWKLYIELEIEQKINTQFKAIVRAANKEMSGTKLTTEVFEFADKSTTRKAIFGNPFERNEDLVNHIIFEYYDYIQQPLVYLRIRVYEIDESSREDLYPLSTTE